ncbi:hypothetical protein IU459_10810 [Nocardia amamiensis]|uniref:UbiC transcription regulator-associated domain-containing protein n=1 Tax=Nocardia amamiensis TaxID=404578 RepID=A0ABS0CQG1_9NOCA|nr:hypothetical protein [Nocardia amamiensis]MBF6298037.1 hypothetical protein [Nocardia amamiensis]
MGAEQDLSDGFPEFRPAPRDIVPRRTLPADDIPVGDAEVTYFEFAEDGIERVSERAYITRPFTREDMP